VPFGVVTPGKLWRFLQGSAIRVDAHGPADGNINAGREGEHVDNDRDLAQFREASDPVRAPLAANPKHIGMIPSPGPKPEFTRSSHHFEFTSWQQ
jgi:hypothetical protein